MTARTANIAFAGLLSIETGLVSLVERLAKRISELLLHQQHASTTADMSQLAFHAARGEDMLTISSLAE